MKKLHGWVIVDTKYNRFVMISANRKRARELKKNVFKGSDFAIRKFEVIEPAPRRKKPVMMICPKAEWCNRYCPSKIRHPENDGCNVQCGLCPKCVEAE